MSEFNNLIELVQIPAGSFLMGSPEVYDDERPQHLVNVPSFLMGKYTVTQAQYEAVMGTNPSYFEGSELPVEQVSWNDAVEFCDELSQLTGRQYRLPTEAEWEYACRAGTTTPYSFGEKLTHKQANFGSNQTSTVGIYLPNSFGLHDMHGNVWEWCLDVWHGNYEDAPSDGSAWITREESESRLMRGGSWLSTSGDCRSAYRNFIHPNLRLNFLGFRVVCGLA